jgi:hypothetical protein
MSEGAVNTGCILGTIERSHHQIALLGQQRAPGGNNRALSLFSNFAVKTLRKRPKIAGSASIYEQFRKLLFWVL